MIKGLDRLNNKLYLTVERNFEKTYANKVNSIESELLRVQKLFFTKLVSKAIGVSSAPNLGQYTPTWVPLSKKYVTQKSSKGYGSGFFSKTGELKTALQGLDARTIFGTPIILFSSAKGSGLSSVAVRKEKWKGQSSERRVIRDSRGRFRSVEDLPNNLKSTMEFDFYPKIKEALANLDEDKYFDIEVSGKLKNPNGKKLRPLVGNFLQWYLDTEVTAAVKKGFKNNVR